MSQKSNQDGILDPNLVQELEEIPTEDPFITEYGNTGIDESQKSIQFAKDWFPDSNEYQGKTNISPQQAKNLALVRHLPEVFDEIKELKPFLEGFVNDYEMYLTSIEGESRKEQLQVLKSVFGGPSETDEATKSAVLQAFANKEIGEDND